MVARKWRVRLSAAAKFDFANIFRWTTENFGERQADNYREVLRQAIGELNAGPDIPRSKALDGIMHGLRTLHVARRDRRGSHLLMYRITAQETIEIIRILHDKMDIPRHMSSDPDKIRE